MTAAKKYGYFLKSWARTKPDKIVSQLLNMTKFQSNKEDVKHIKQQLSQSIKIIVPDIKNFSSEMIYTEIIPDLKQTKSGKANVESAYYRPNALFSVAYKVFKHINHPEY